MNKTRINILGLPENEFYFSEEEKKELEFSTIFGDLELP